MSLDTKYQKPQHTTHSKKRYGLHQKHTKPFKDTYWPYLPLLLIVGVGFVINVAWAHPASVLGYATDLSATQLLQDTNSDRAQHQETGLALNSQLTAAASAKANDMVTRNYWSHDTPDGSPPWTFVIRSGYHYQKAGENLAYGFSSAEATLNAWMHSPEHRANVLGQDYTDVGFGIASAKDYQGTGPQTIVVAMYGEKAAGVATTASQPHSTPTNSTTTGTVQTDQALPSARRVARIQLLTSSNASWALIVLTVSAALAALLFLVRHGLMWRRVIIHGEAFIIHHRLLDAVIVAMAVAGFILSRTAGLIQ